MSFSRFLVCFSVAVLALINADNCSAAVATNSQVNSAEKQPADLVMMGGVIHCMDASRSKAQAIAIRGERIVYVGSDKGAQSFIGAQTQRIDLHGQMVLPGFVDSHVHPLASELEADNCTLYSCKTKPELLETIRKYAEANPKEPWILGGGWSLPIFPNASPDKEDLDKIIPDRPVFLVSQDGHSAWVNSKALAECGISSNTTDPRRGRIERRPGSSEPSGTLREAAASLVETHAPKPSADQRMRALQRVLPMFNALGITCVQDACVEKDNLETYVAADRKGLLTMHVEGALYVDPDKNEDQIEELKSLRQRAEKCRDIHTDFVKMFADGVIEAHTAAMLERYIGPNGESLGQGMLNFDPAQMSKLATLLDAAGFNIHIHAIGDRAVRTSLDAIAAAKAANGGRTGARHQIAHLQVIQPEDQTRFAKLGVIANFQPYWCVADEYMTKQTEPVLGKTRSALQYPIASIAKTGATIAGGSDWSVTTNNPLEEIEVALTHRTPDDQTSPVWNPAEKVGLDTILPAFTINGAYACGQEKETGSLEAGKLADVVVIDKNLFAIPADGIHKAKVVYTLFRGKFVYRSGQIASSRVQE